MRLAKSSGRFQALIVSAVLAIFLAGPAFAGLDVWTDVTLADGVLWRQKTYSSLFGGKQTVNVLDVDLNNARMVVKPLRPSSGCQVVSTLGSNAGALGAINGGFFDGSCASLSMIRIDDTVYATNPSWKPARSTLGLLDNTSSITPYIQQIAYNNSWSAVDHALGGGPNLVTNGAIDVTLTAEGFDSSYASKNPRTAVGFTSDNKLLMVTVDGRTSAGVGMTLDELAQFMIWLGCVKAMNLDGGGSTTMWVSGQGVVNTPSDGSQRPVTSALGVWLEPPPTYIVDNGGAGYSEVGSWSTSANAGYYGTNSRYIATGSGANTATWTPTLGDTAKYEVYAWWVAGSNRANNAVYKIHHANGVSNVTVNQTANGGKWNLLGTYSFLSGTSGKVVLSDAAQAGKVVSADAVKLVYKAPAELIVDNTDAGFSASANWWTSTSTPGYLGANYHVRATAAVTDPAAWSVTLSQTRPYKVYVNYTSGSNRAAAAPYVVYHSGGSTTVYVNQQANGGTWVYLGQFTMNSGTATRVGLSCWTTAGYYVVADAIKLIPQ